MSLREKFLKDFNSISLNFTEDISVRYASDFKYSLGISYFELNRVSNELCHCFLKLARGNSQYIGVSLSDYFFLPCIVLGIWKSGSSFAGVASQYTNKNNLDFLNFLKIKYLISDSSKSDYDDELVFQFTINEQRYFIWDRQPRTEQVELGIFEDICYGIMTSGSTGEPKMIQVPWSCILPNAIELAKEFQVTKHDCIFQGSPYSFDPFFIELLVAFLSGCSLMIVSNVIKLCPSDLLKILFEINERGIELPPKSCNCKENHFHVNVQQVKKKKISILQMTPSVFKRWPNNKVQELVLSGNTSLRILILGGEKFPEEILQLKSHDNKTRIFNIYGITEISCWAFLNEITNYSCNGRISIGKPLKDIFYKITDSGELHIGSSSRICFVNEEKNFKNEIFRKTGDVVELSENKIYFLGRINQIVKKFGMKINLNKIEFLFLKNNKFMKECFAIYNEKNLKLGLFYVPLINKESADVNYKVKTISEFCENHKFPADDIKDIEKPDYFIEMTKTPLNFHGKCDKYQLLHFLKSIKNKIPEENPKNIFKHIWFEILSLKSTDLFSSSFTELGGNSVLGLNLIAKLEDEGFSVPQNFITILLGKNSYDDCLKCLSLGLEKSGAPRKRLKFSLKAENFGLSIRWKFDLGKCVDATPTYFTYQGEERIVVGSHSSKLSCLNPDSGCNIWTTFLGDRIESRFRPTKDGSNGFIGCYDRYVYCVACSDGSIIWKYKTGDMVKSTPCLSSDERIVYVASYDTNLYCLTTDEGQPKATLKLSNGGIFCSGIISDSLNNFYIGTLDGTCIALSQETNEPIWKTVLESPVFASPCLISNQAKILFSEVLGNVHCLDALTGAKLWTFKSAGNIYSSPIVEELDCEKHIIFGCHDAHLYCLRVEKEPELKWKQQLDSSVFAKPSVALESSSVCAASTKGFIYLCDLDSGSIKARMKLDGEVFSSPVQSNDRLFIGCRNNNVYCINILKVED